MSRAETKGERSPINDSLSLYITSIATHLRKVGLDYWAIVEHKGVSLNLHINGEWSLKDKDENDVFPLFEGQTLEDRLSIDELLPSYAKLMHYKEILERAPKKDRKHTKRMKKYVKTYVERNKSRLKVGFTTSVIDAMGRIDRTEPIDI